MVAIAKLAKAKSSPSSSKKLEEEQEMLLNHATMFLNVSRGKSVDSHHAPVTGTTKNLLNNATNLCHLYDQFQAVKSDKALWQTLRAKAA